MDHKVRTSRPAWPTWGNRLYQLINRKISWAWWCAPVISATQEAEAEELLELRRQFAVSPDRVTALQPGQQIRLRLKKIIIINKKEEERAQGI